MTLTSGDVDAVARAVVKLLAASPVPVAAQAGAMGGAAVPVQEAYSVEDFAGKISPERSTWWVRKMIRVGKLKVLPGGRPWRIPHEELVRLQSLHAETRRRGGFNF